MSSHDLRKSAGAVLDAALRAANPEQAMRKALSFSKERLTVPGREIDLNGVRDIVVVGAGKAGGAMSRAAEEILGERISAGRVVVKDGHKSPTNIIELSEASHPVPDERGVEAGRSIAELVEQYARPETLFLCLLSGGGSALLVSPAGGVSLSDKQEVTRRLLASGAEIGEINAVRKHLSGLKGGGLARLAAPGKVVSLIISDVVGDRLDVIASGPTVGDHSTWDDCKRILAGYGIWDNAPESVRARIQAGLNKDAPETLKPGAPELENVSNHIIAGNRQALAAAETEARNQGFAPLILSSTIEGETKDIARMHAAMAREVRESGSPMAAPCCLISGGETTVTLGRDHGLGGRNMEFALAAALELDGLKGVLALSAGTDGTDGPTDAAGALCDDSTLARAAEKRLSPVEFLAGHDAYHFFEALGDLIITGPTRTNVMDVRLMMVEP